MRITYLTLLLTCICFLPVFAQKKGKCTEKEFHAKKQAYITEKAGLTAEEAEKFFPLYFELHKKKKAANKSTWDIARKGKQAETSEAEYEKIIDAFFEGQHHVLDLEKEYINKYREIISDKKIYLVYWAEIKFNRNMMKILQEMKDKDPK